MANNEANIEAIINPNMDDLRSIPLPNVVYILGKPIRHNFSEVTKKSEDFMNLVAATRTVRTDDVGRLLQIDNKEEYFQDREILDVHDDWPNIQTAMYRSMTALEYTATKHLLGTLTLNWFRRIEWDSEPESDLSSQSQELNDYYNA